MKKAVILVIVIILTGGGIYLWQTSEKGSTETETSKTTEEKSKIEEDIEICKMLDDDCFMRAAAEHDNMSLCEYTADQKKCKKEAKEWQELMAEIEKPQDSWKEIPDEVARESFAIGKDRTKEEYLGSCTANVGGVSLDQEMRNECFMYGAYKYDDLSLCDRTSDPEKCKEDVKETEKTQKQIVELEMQEAEE